MASLSLRCEPEGVGFMLAVAQDFPGAGHGWLLVSSGHADAYTDAAAH